MTNTTLTLWKDRAARCEAAYAAELSAIDSREALYAGAAEIESPGGAPAAKSASHVRNIVSELIEAQVDSAVPQPKVTARRIEDEPKAKLIEDMLRNELNRLDFESFNDLQERTTLIQGSGLFLVEWDEERYTPHTHGELRVIPLHPRQLLPQPGVTEGIEAMDYVILTLSQTRQALRRRYNVTLEPDAEEREDGGDELVCQYIAYYRGPEDEIGLFSWAEDTVLEDNPRYQSRQRYTCRSCGAVGYERCLYCGGEDFRRSAELYETPERDIVLDDGRVIPAVTDGEPTRLPYYRPGRYPLVLRKNVSVYGKLTGDSDVDKLRDAQNTIKKLSTKIGEKLLKGGSYVTLPTGVYIDKSDSELKIIHLENPVQKQLIDVINVQPNIGGDMAYAEHVYEEARQAIGITDSFMGRRDPTATSGVAKEFAAAQSAGRFESKRVMKNAAYAALFELMFRYKLAYADEPRPVVSLDSAGAREYRSFNRYDFLEQDENGDWYWNDDFLFSTDVAAPLAANREALWQETIRNFKEGTFGDPARLETLILYWTKLELLHYPGAGATKARLEEQLAGHVPPSLTNEGGTAAML